MQNNFENLLNGIEYQINKKEKEELISMKEKLFIEKIEREKKLVRNESNFYFIWNAFVFFNVIFQMNIYI